MTLVQRCLRHPIDRHLAGCPDCMAHLRALHASIPSPRTAPAPVILAAVA